MKFVPLKKNRKHIYILFVAIWLVLYALGFIFQCESVYPALEILIASTAIMLVILAWAISSYESITPKGIKNLSILGAKTILEFFLLLLIFLVALIPLVLLTPHYTCYNDRAHNAEVIAYITPVKLQITDIIEANGTLNNDYSSVSLYFTEKIDFIKVTSEGIILVHAKEPDFTVYLTPSTNNGTVSWSCKAFPPKKAPAMCR